MTFSIAARDPATGAFGMAVSSSSPAVAARCIHLRPGVGVVASQNITDPGLGMDLLDALASGMSADVALAALVGSEPTIDYRQIAVVGSTGEPAVRSGRFALGTYASAVGADVVAAGNMLADPAIPAAMVAAFESAAGTLEQRLLAGLVEGLAAGGELGPVRSAGLSVVEGVRWRVTDLRVDDHDDPVGELGRLVDLWAPAKDDYVTRGLDPASAPAYGVPGDE